MALTMINNRLRLITFFFFKYSFSSKFTWCSRTRLECSVSRRKS